MKTIEDKLVFPKSKKFKKAQRNFKEIMERIEPFLPKTSRMGYVENTPWELSRKSPIPYKSPPPIPVYPYRGGRIIIHPRDIPYNKLG